MQGVITSVKPEKGLAFVRDESGADRFIHHSESLVPLATLAGGMTVEFDAYTVPPTAKNNGLRARQVRPVTA